MDEPTCSIDGCERPILVKLHGWCGMHYQRWQKHGNPLGPVKEPRPETCIIDGCDEPVKVASRGWCRKHFRRWQYAGDPLAPDRRHEKRDPEARFFEKVGKNGTVPAHRPELGPCWLWTGAAGENGYGTFWADGQFISAHRWSYQHFKDEIPDGYDVDHVCHPGDGSCPVATCPHHACVNPAHLEAVTHRVNTLRGYTIAAINVAKTHCPKGHPYDEGNTLIRARGDGEGRKCKECSRMEPFLGPRFHRNAAKTHCPQGHPYDEENTFYIKDGGGRRCKICMKASWARANAAARAKRLAQQQGALS